MNLFVKNVPLDWSHRDLYMAFHNADLGSIVSARVSIKATYESRGYGFVQYKTSEATAKAIELVSESEFDLLAE